MSKNKEIEFDFSNSHNFTSNNISDFNDYNNDIPSSFNETLNNIKNNINNNDYSNNNFRKLAKNTFTGNLINLIFYNENSLNLILNYLNISDISYFRGVNHYILHLVHKYFNIRFNLAIQSIISFQNENEQLIKAYMNNIDEQIPVTRGNWLDLNLEKNLFNLRILNPELISNIIINNEIEIHEDIYKFLLIVIGFNNKDILDNEKINLKRVCESIFSNQNINEVIQNIDYENINDIEIMKILNILNNPELSIIYLKEKSADYAKLILWIQSVISFHILIHPYIYRNNKSSIKPYSKVYHFINQMEKKIEKFYKFKRFLIYLNIININVGEYVFTVQQTNNNNSSKIKKLKKKFDNYDTYIYHNINNSKILGNILSYLPFKYSYKFRSVSKNFSKAFKLSIDILLFSTLKELYFFRLQFYDEYKEEISSIFSHNIFSKYFLMLDEILNEPLPPYKELISKEEISELKILKSKNEYIYTISKIFCELANIKIIKTNKEGKKDYIGALSMLAIKGELLKIMKNCNKLYFSQKKIYSIYNQLKNFFDFKILKRIKNINRSMYYILIWEIFILQYLKIYNILDFINLEDVKEKYNNTQIEFIEYFLKLMDYLRYILNIRFHFFSKNKRKKETSYGFKEAIEKLLNYLIANNLTYKSEKIMQSCNENFENIGFYYFNDIQNQNNKSKKNLPFYERIINEFLMSYYEDYNNINDDNYFININNNIGKSKNDLSLEINSLDSIIDNDNNTVFKQEKNNNTIYSNKLSKGINKNNSFKEIKLDLYNNKTYYNNLNIKKKYKSKINDIPDKIFIKYILFYNDFNTIYNFGMSNKRFLYCFRIHMHLRLYFLNKEKLSLEEKNLDFINIINNKRRIFYSKNEINPPNKEHSEKLINKLKIKDIQGLKQYFKKYNKIYVSIITPFLLLLNQKIITKIKNKENKLVYYFQLAKSILYYSNNNKLIKKLNSLEIELIPQKIINKVEELLIKNEYFKPEYMKRFNPCFSNIISWVIGILELFKILRKYAINICDSEILEIKEIQFCKEMDDSILNYYKVLRYTNYFCKNYENDAKELMHEMDIIIN